MWIGARYLSASRIKSSMASVSARSGLEASRSSTSGSIRPCAQQSLGHRLYRPRNLGVRQQRQSRAAQPLQRRTQLGLIHPRAKPSTPESMRKHLNPRTPACVSGSRESHKAHHAAPCSPVHPCLAFRGIASSAAPPLTVWNAIFRNGMSRSASSLRPRPPRRSLKALPIAAARLIDVNMSGQRQGPASAQIAEVMGLAASAQVQSESPELSNALTFTSRLLPPENVRQNPG